MSRCECRDPHRRQRIVLTGGPGAGKTAVLELVRQSFCPHVKVLPEAAGILFAGGFPRRGDGETRRASQRAIFYVQRELELAADVENLAIVLCDRGTVDGSAYWPGPDDFWGLSGRRLTNSFAGTMPSFICGRPRSARVTTTRIRSVSSRPRRRRRLMPDSRPSGRRHPRRFEVPSTSDFLDKAGRVLQILSGELPDCCRRYERAESRSTDCGTAREAMTACR